MKYFVISLKRTPQRLEQFFAWNPCRDMVEIFEAIDGREMTWRKLEELGVVKDRLQYYSVGSVGTAASHFLLWKQVAHSNEAVTIFEDDAILHRDFFSKTEDVIRSTDADWDFIQWGWNFDACMSFMLPGTESICHGFFDQDHLRTKATVFQQQDVNPNLYRLHTSFGYMACTISPAGARRLLQGCFPLKEKLISIDAYHRSIISYGLDVAAVECHRQRDSKSYVCFPPLAISKNESETSTNINSGKFR